MCHQPYNVKVTAKRKMQGGGPVKAETILTRVGWNNLQNLGQLDHFIMFSFSVIIAASENGLCLLLSKLLSQWDIYELRKTGNTSDKNKRKWEENWNAKAVWAARFGWWWEDGLFEILSSAVLQDFFHITPVGTLTLLAHKNEVISLFLLAVFYVNDVTCEQNQYSLWWVSKRHI